MNTHLIKNIGLARELEKHGNHSAAIRAYQGLLCNSHSDREVLLNLGGLYARIGRIDDALLSYRECLNHGEDYLLHYNLGSVYYKKGEYKKAIFHLNRSRTINAVFMPAILVMGMSYSRLRNLRAAEHNFNLVLNALPYNRTALVSLALLYAGRGDTDNALVLLDKALLHNPSSRRIRELKSALLLKAGKSDESAIEIKAISKSDKGFRYFEEFIKSVPVDVYTDKYGTLDDKIEILMEKTDRSPSTLISLSLCHLLKGETDTAIDFLFQAHKECLN